MKFVLVVPAVFGLLAAAAAPPSSPPPSVASPNTPPSGVSPNTPSQCNTGSPKCCKNVGAAGSTPINALLKPLNIALDDPTAIIGLECTTLTLVGDGKGTNCAEHPVCCKDVKFDGVVNVGCTPISL
ncbi:hydrophobin [Hysterangium stoloniferum]|nr:hydrophobin [Hysterangium stoloniferum]